MNTEPQPKNYDAVIGGNLAPPSNGMVLGGFDRIKRLFGRGVNSTFEQKSMALSQALDYGERGLDLVIRALRDDLEQIQWLAYEELRGNREPKVKLALELFLEGSTKYKRLRNLLSAKKWQEADMETTAIMLRWCDLAPNKRLNHKDLLTFPCEDLYTLDRLWLKHSNRHFGFSVQQRIWEKCQQSRWDKGEAWSLLGDRIGWRVNNLFVDNYWKRHDELSFSSLAPVGHLPFVFGIFTVEPICDRLKTCKLHGDA